MRGRARMLDAHARGARKLSAYAPMALRSPQRQLDQEAGAGRAPGRAQCCVAPSLCCHSPLPLLSLLPPAATKKSRKNAYAAAPAALAPAKKPLPLSWRREGELPY